MIRRMGPPTLNQRRAGLVKGLLPSSASPVTSADALQLRERAFNRASRWKQSRRSPAGYGKGRFASAHVLRLYPTQAVGPTSARAEAYSGPAVGRAGASTDEDWRQVVARAGCVAICRRHGRC